MRLHRTSRPEALRGRVGRRRDRNEAGVTLVELAIVMVTLLILFAMTVPIVDTLFSTIARVNNTYINVNQLLPVSTNLQRFVRSAVEPGPTSAGVPVPAFVTGALTPTSMTFYTNVGAANGPAKIVASCTSTAPSTGVCDSSATFTVTEAQATSSTCPPTGTACTWGTAQTLISVTGVDNANTNTPLFIYTLLQTNSSSSGTTYTTSQVGDTGANGSPTNCPSQATSASVASCYYNNDNSTFASCTSTGSTTGNVLANCPSAEVYAVTIDIQVNSVTSGKNAAGQAEDDTTVYLLSPVSDDYQASVG
jgi:hypothetical protein